MSSEKELPLNPAYRVDPYHDAVLKEIMFDAYVYRQTWTVIHFIDKNDLVNEGLQIEQKVLTFEIEIWRFAKMSSRQCYSIA